MSTVNALKKEVALISKALNLNGQTPDWKKRSEEITQILKACEAERHKFLQTCRNKELTTAEITLLEIQEAEEIVFNKSIEQREIEDRIFVNKGVWINRVWYPNQLDEKGFIIGRV